MLKKLIELSMVALVVIAAAGAYFKWVGALPISVTQTQKTSTFDVSGEGRQVVAPDQASVSMGVRKQGRNIKQVQEQVNSTMAQLSKSLKDMGIKEEDIKTTQYTFHPDYGESGMFSAYAQVGVKVRDLDNVSPVLDLVGQLGLENVSGPSFELSDDLREKTIKAAREEAVEQAKKKAEELAGLAGMKLGRIVNVQEGSNYPVPYLQRDMMVMESSASNKTDTPVEPGTSEVSVSVTLSYETR
jgi:uncharacterized protein YggE